MTKARVGFDIEDENPKIETLHQYGMTYPDGTIRWDHDPGGRTVNFRKLAAGSTTEDEDWGKLLEARAKAAAIPLADYEQAHQMIRRTITIAVTVPEDVS